MGGQAEGRLSLPLGAQTVVLCSQYMTEMYTIQRIGPDRYRQQFDTTPILISALQWLHMPCNAPTWFYKVGKKLSVKANLATYSHILDVSGRCMSVSLTLGIKLDFNSCANWDHFCWSSHI